MLTFDKNMSSADLVKFLQEAHDNAQFADIQCKPVYLGVVEMIGRFAHLVDGGKDPRKLESVINIHVDTKAILAGLEGAIQSRIDETVSFAKSDLDVTEFERAALVCDKVAADSRSALFRSGAKICAANIRAMAANEAFPALDEGEQPLYFDKDKAALSLEQLATEYLQDSQIATGAELDRMASMRIFARLVSDKPKDGYCWNDERHIFEEKDSLFRARISAETEAFNTTGPDDHPRFGCMPGVIIPPPPTRTVEIKTVVPPAPPIYTFTGAALDEVGRAWGICRKRWLTLHDCEKVEDDETYRRRILDRIELKTPARAPLELATGKDLDSHGEEWGLPRFVEAVGDLPGRIVESDADYRARIWTHIYASPSGGKGQEG